MTMSLTLVNTSNWDGEDYQVTDENSEIHTIKPGEKVTFNPHKEVNILVSPIKDKEIPFMMNGRRVTPQVNIGFK